MILWLLQRFSAFRNLLGEVDELKSALSQIAQEKALLEDRLEASQQDRDRLWQTMQIALANERESYRMQINHAVQKSGGGIPYPESHSLPPNSVRPVQAPGPVGRSGRLLTSEAVMKSRAAFMEEFVEDLGKRAKVNG